MKTTPTNMNRSGTAMTAFEATLEARDAETSRHAFRTAAYAVVLGRRLGLSADALSIVERGTFLHDIGKVHVPDRVLKKRDLFTESDWKTMRTHAVTGYGMLASLPGFHEIAQIILAHHERYDGSGYPHRLEGEDIPLGARICAVVDCFDALTSTDRPYSGPVGFRDACGYLDSQRGRHFDPLVVEAFLSITPAEWQGVAASLAAPRIRRTDWQTVESPAMTTSALAF